MKSSADVIAKGGPKKSSVDVVAKVGLKTSSSDVIAVITKSCFADVVAKVGPKTLAPGSNDFAVEVDRAARPEPFCCLWWSVGEGALTRFRRRHSLRSVSTLELLFDVVLCIDGAAFEV